MRRVTSHLTKGVTRKAGGALFAAAVALAAPGPAFAQMARPIDRAISNTLHEHYQQHGASGSWEADQPIIQRAWQSLMSGPQSWIQMIDWQNWPWPFNLLWGNRPCEWKGQQKCGGQFGGGGADGSWDTGGQKAPNCNDFKYTKSLDGRLTGPAVPLPTGGPQQRALSTPTFTVEGKTAATSEGAAVLWWLSQGNNGKGGHHDTGEWFGVYAVEKGQYSTVYKYSNVARRGSDGNVIPSELRYTGANPVQYHWETTRQGDFNKSVDCPPEATTSDLDFYTSNPTGDTNGWSECTMYAKNFGVSPSGYGYPSIVSIPTDSFKDYYTSFPAAAACPVDPSLIAKIAQKVMDKVLEDPNAKGPKKKISLEDVRVGQDDPRGDELGEKPAGQMPAPEPSNSRPPTDFDPQFPDVPKKPATPSGPEGYPDNADPAVGAPSLSPPELSMPDWFPWLPSLSIPVGTGECPVYEFEAFGFQHRLEAHCPLAEQNRALISTIMLVIFTIGAATVVMRA